MRHPARIQERLTFDTPEVRRAWIEVLLVFVEIHFGGCHRERTRPDECRRFGRVYAGIAERLGIDGNSRKHFNGVIVIWRGRDPHLIELKEWAAVCSVKSRLTKFGVFESIFRRRRESKVTKPGLAHLPSTFTAT